MKIRWANKALEDLADCLVWSVEWFGPEAALRYRTLVKTAILKIQRDPLLPGSKDLEGIRNGTRIYHLRFSRHPARVDGIDVKRPRHFIVYSCEPPGLLVVLRILHDQQLLDLAGEEE